MTVYKKTGVDGKPIRVRANSTQEAEAYFAEIEGQAAPPPIASRGGAPSTIGARKPGFLESFGEQAGDIVGSIPELPGALYDAGKSILTDPGGPDMAVGKMAGSAVDSIKKRLGLLGEGRIGEFAGRTAADALSFASPGRVGEMLRPAESIAGGSAILRAAEGVGIKPRRKLLGLRDAAVDVDPLRGAGGNSADVLRRSHEAMNAELGQMGVPPVQEAQNLDSLRRGAAANIEGVDTARKAAAQQTNVTNDAATAVANARRELEISTENARRKAAVAAENEAGKASVDKWNEAQKAAHDRLREKARGEIAGKFGEAGDAADVGDTVVARIEHGRKAAGNVLGPAVSEAKKPFLGEAMPAEDLARIAGEYGQEFPGVTDAVGKLLFDEGKGLTYGAVDEIKRKLGYVGSDKNKAARGLSKKLQATALDKLRERGHDVSGIEKANAAYEASLGTKGLYGKGRPGKVLRSAIGGESAKVLDISLKEGRAWEQVMQALDDPLKFGGGEAAGIEGARAKEVLRNSVVHRSFGLSKGIETFSKKWAEASPRTKIAIFGPTDTKAINSILSEYGPSLQNGPLLREAPRPNVAKSTLFTPEAPQPRAVAQPVTDTPKLAQLREVWEQYSPSRNLGDSPIVPTSRLGFIRLFGVALAANKGAQLRRALYQATKLGKPAMLYNLVAQQTRIERRTPREDVQTFEDYQKQAEEGRQQ